VNIDITPFLNPRGSCPLRAKRMCSRDWHHAGTQPNQTGTKRNQAQALSRLAPGHTGTKRSHARNQAKLQPLLSKTNAKQAKVLQKLDPGRIGTERNQARVLKNNTFADWNQVEPNRNQSEMLQIIHYGQNGAMWNQAEPSAEPSQIATPPQQNDHVRLPPRLLFIILDKRRASRDRARWRHPLTTSSIMKGALPHGASGRAPTVPVQNNGRSVDYLAHCTVGEVIDVLQKLDFATSHFCNEANGMRTFLQHGIIGRLIRVCAQL